MIKFYKIKEKVIKKIKTQSILKVNYNIKKKN